MKRVYIYSIIVASSLAVGALFGFGSKKLFTKQVDYSDVNFDSFIPDYDNIVRKIDSYKGSQKIVDAFPAHEIANYSLEKFRRNENCFTFTMGISHTSVTEQLISGYNIKNGNKYFEESLSKSNIVAVADRMYMTGAKTDTTIYEGNKDSIYITDEACGATYIESSKRVVDAETYKTTYGKTIDEMFIYLVCEQSTLNSEIKEVGSGYQIILELDTEISTQFNKLQMKNISNLDTYPVFKDVKLTFDLDKDLALKKVNIDENYSAKKVVSTKAHAIIDIYFSNTYLKIPELNEPISSSINSLFLNK